MIPNPFAEPDNEALQKLDQLKARVNNGVTGLTNTEIGQLIDGIEQYQERLSMGRDLAESVLKVVYESDGVAVYRGKNPQPVAQWKRFDFVRELENLALMTPMELKERGDDDAGNDDD